MLSHACGYFLKQQVWTGSHSRVPFIAICNLRLFMLCLVLFTTHLIRLHVQQESVEPPQLSNAREGTDRLTGYLPSGANEGTCAGP